MRLFRPQAKALVRADSLSRNKAMWKMNPIRLLVVDDRADLRQNVVEVLRSESDLEVVGEADNGQQAIDLAFKLKPDIVLMDVSMPMVSGIEATRRIRDTLPAVRVLVLTADQDIHYVFALLEAGASGYLFKSTMVRGVVDAIHQTLKGQVPLDPAILGALNEDDLKRVQQLIQAIESRSTPV